MIHVRFDVLLNREHTHEHSILSHRLGRFSLAGHRVRRILLRLNVSSSYHPWMPARRPCKRTTVCYAHSYACGFVGDAVEKLATGPEELNISLYDLALNYPRALLELYSCACNGTPCNGHVASLSPRLDSHQNFNPDCIVF